MFAGAGRHSAETLRALDMEDADPQIVLFRTGKVYEFDMVAGELKQAEIPCFTSQETSAGLRLATPATLTGDAGTWWTIRVPQSRYEEAKRLVESLPCGQKNYPEVWDFATPEARKSLQWLYRILGLLSLLAVLWLLLRTVLDNSK